MALLSLKVSVDYPFCYGRPLINNYTDEHDYNLVLLYRVCSIKFHCAIKRAKSVFSFFDSSLSTSSKFGVRSEL